MMNILGTANIILFFEFRTKSPTIITKEIIHSNEI